MVKLMADMDKMLKEEWNLKKTKMIKCKLSKMKSSETQCVHFTFRPITIFFFKDKDLLQICL